jgi:hypothetical protein
MRSGARKRQSFMASEGAHGTKAQAARNIVAGKASLPGRPGAGLAVGEERG